MPKSVLIRAVGGPEALELVDLPGTALKAGEIRLKHTVIGFNYLDVYLRKGVYEIPLPAVLGVEGVGTITEVGTGVTGLAIGDRVAYPYDLGAYASERTLPATRAIKLDPSLSDDQVAASLMKGITAHMLVKNLHQVGPGDTVLVHAAAGGVGSIIVQWAKALGAQVIGTVGSVEKASLALASGADIVAVLGSDDVAAIAHKATAGRGVSVVYDSVGRDTFELSLATLRPFGKLISYGVASGEIDAIAPRQLSRAGSVFFNRAAIDHYINGDPEQYRAAAADVLQAIGAGLIRTHVGQRFSLSEVEAAHRQAEARGTSGATLLIP